MTRILLILTLAALLVLLAFPASADLRGMGVFAPKPAPAKPAPPVNPFTTGPVSSGVPAVPPVSTTATKAALPTWLPGIEAGACLSIGPDQETLGARVGLGLFNFPDNWVLFGGRRLFADAITVEGMEKFALGLSMSLMPAASDNNLRIGLAWWRVGDEDKLAGYVAYPIAGF